MALRFKTMKRPSLLFCCTFNWEKKKKKKKKSFRKDKTQEAASIQEEVVVDDDDWPRPWFTSDNAWTAGASPLHTADIRGK